jgi:hypothetical protein
MVDDKCSAVRDKGIYNKSNPSCVAQGYVDSYSTLGHVRGRYRCGGYTLMRVATTHAG